MARWLELVSLDELLRKPAPRNPRGHDQQGLRESLDRFGYVEAVTIDERTGRLVAGHGRVEDLSIRRDAGEQAPDGVEVSDDGTWMVPTQRGWASGSDDAAEAYVLASNRVGEGLWDAELLTSMFRDYEENPEWLRGTGFDESEVAALLRGDETETVEFEARVKDEYAEDRTELTFSVKTTDRGVILDTLDRLRVERGLTDSADALALLCRSA